MELVERQDIFADPWLEIAVFSCLNCGQCWFASMIQKNRIVSRLNLGKDPLRFFKQLYLSVLIEWVRHYVYVIMGWEWASQSNLWIRVCEISFYRTFWAFLKATKPLLVCCIGWQFRLLLVLHLCGLRTKYRLSRKRAVIPCFVYISVVCESVWLGWPVTLYALRCLSQFQHSLWLLICVRILTFSMKSTSLLVFLTYRRIYSQIGNNICLRSFRMYSEGGFGSWTWTSAYNWSYKKNYVRGVLCIFCRKYIVECDIQAVSSDRDMPECDVYMVDVSHFG